MVCGIRKSKIFNNVGYTYFYFYLFLQLHTPSFTRRPCDKLLMRVGVKGIFFPTFLRILPYNGLMASCCAGTLI
jgi:hypothetical protein